MSILLTHTHIECVQLERLTPDTGETVVDEQVEQAACVQVGRKLALYTTT